jgi:WD40 repeat protein
MVLRGHTAPVLTVLYSFDSKRLVSSDANGEVIIWNTETGSIMRKIKAHNDLVQDVSFAGDNKTILTGSLDHHLRLWDSNGPLLLTDIDLGVGIWSVDLVSDASILIAGCDDGSVRLLRKGAAPNTKKGKK